MPGEIDRGEEQEGPPAVAPGLDLPLLASSRHFQVDGGIQDGRQKAGRDGTAEESLFAAQPAQVRGRQVGKDLRASNDFGEVAGLPITLLWNPGEAGTSMRQVFSLKPHSKVAK